MQSTRRRGGIWFAALGATLATLACTPSPRLAAKSEPRTRLDEDACAGCHAAQVHEWAGSMHHAAFTSPDFQRSWQAEPRAFCADCHAPRRALGAVGEQAGIGCVECHDGVAEHLRTRSKVTTRSCVPCHDFPVPHERSFLQSTEREHAESPFADTPCSSCHHGHAYAASRDPQRLAAALAVSSEGYAEDAITIVLAPRGVGHRFPTGDIFRRVTVTISATDATGRIVCDRIVQLNRDWSEHRRSLHAHDEESLAHDTRLAGPTRFAARCVARPNRARVTVDYARGATAEGASFSAFEELELLDVGFDVP